MLLTSPRRADASALPGGRRLGAARAVRHGFLVAALLAAAGAAGAQTTDVLVNQDAVPASASGPAGGTFHYVVKVRHNTGTAATGVRLTDTLPLGSVFQSVTTSARAISADRITTHATANRTQLRIVVSPSTDLQFRPTASDVFPRRKRRLIAKNCRLRIPPIQLAENAAVPRRQRSVR